MEINRIELKDNDYLMSEDILHENEKVSDILDKIGVDFRMTFNCYESLGENPNFDIYGKPGIYPFYQASVTKTDGSQVAVAWGTLIVLPYQYLGNGTVENAWFTQIIVGATGWNGESTMVVLCRRNNYFGGPSLWNLVKFG